MVLPLLEAFSDAGTAHVSSVSMFGVIQIYMWTVYVPLPGIRCCLPDVVVGQFWRGGLASLTWQAVVWCGGKPGVVAWQAGVAWCGSLASWASLMWWAGKPGKAFLHKTTICCLSSGNTLGSVSDWQETDGKVSVHSSKCWFSRRGSVQKWTNKNPFHKRNMFQCRWSQKHFAQSQKCKTFVTQPSLHRVTTAWWC